MSMLLLLAVASAAVPAAADANAASGNSSAEASSGLAPGSKPEDLAPATIPAIAAAAKACIGVTADPAAVAARFADWADTTAGMSPGQVEGMKKAGGRMLTRGNVRVALNPAPDAVCVVLAAINPSLDRQALQAALSQAAGTSVTIGAPATLSTGETMSAEVSARMAMIIVTTPKIAQENDLPGQSGAGTLDTVTPDDGNPGADPSAPNQSQTAPSTPNGKED